jgi:hypothetical protein
MKAYIIYLLIGTLLTSTSTLILNHPVITLICFAHGCTG